MNVAVLNLALALLWLFLSPEPSLVSFGTGYLLGFALLALFQSVLPDSAYLRRTRAFARFLGRFALEFLRSNLAIARAILFRPVAELRPDFIRYDVRGMTPTEILMLSHCITLTPGTTTVEVAPDWSCLILHAFDAADPDSVRSSIDRGLRNPLLEFTR